MCSDNVNNRRTLPFPATLTGQVTIENCTSTCFQSGFQFSGAEYSTYVKVFARWAAWFWLSQNRECYCGSTIAPASGPVPLTDCNIVCAGNTSELCGGANRLTLYNYTGSDLPPRAPMNVFPVKSGLPTGWAYNACWVWVITFRLFRIIVDTQKFSDNVNGRIFPLLYSGTSNNTVEYCVEGCASLNYSVAGLEFGGWPSHPIDLSENLIFDFLDRWMLLWK